MLSKVAERVYWIARYLERVESTARLVSIYDQLLFDMPRSVKLSWYNLITINSMDHAFNERFSVRDERNVMKFLLGDPNNPASMLSSLKAIRENIRTTRDVIPAETWELINELSLYVQENLQQGVSRSKRHQFLENVIKGCQQILGLLYGSMPHDAAWEFLRLGRNLERADMTTRNLDAAVAAILEMEEGEHVVNSQQIIWGNVLRSLNASQSYRRTTRISVKGSAVAQYLLEDDDFPKSIAHCLNAFIESSAKLPRSKEMVAKLNTITDKIFKKVDYEKLDEPFRDYLNDLQIKLGDIHALIAETWFPEIE